MRAFALTDFGAAPEIVDIPLPEPAEGEVRVRVAAFTGGTLGKLVITTA